MDYIVEALPKCKVISKCIMFSVLLRRKNIFFKVVFLLVRTVFSLLEVCYSTFMVFFFQVQEVRKRFNVLKEQA